MSEMACLQHLREKVWLEHRAIDWAARFSFIEEVRSSDHDRSCDRAQ